MSVSGLSIPKDHQTWSFHDPLILKSYEYDLLFYLALSPNRVFTKEQIYQHIYEDVESEVDNRVYGLVKNLRKKIEENPEEPHYIETIRGVGYRFRA